MADDMAEMFQAQQAAQASQAASGSSGNQTLTPAQEDTPAPAPTITPDQPVQQDQNSPLTDVSFMGPPKAAKGAAPTLLDYGKQLWRSVGETDSSLLSAASWTARQLSANPETIAHIEKMRADADAYNQDIFNRMTPAGQAAAQASIFGGKLEDGSAAPTVGDVGLVHYAMMNGASFIPDAVLALTTPEIAAPLGARIAGSIGAAAAKAAVNGGVFGAIQLGNAYHEFVKDVDAMPDAQYQQQNPAYAQMRASGMSEMAAKSQVVAHTYTNLGAMQFGIGAVTGAGVGHLLSAGPLGGAGKGLLQRLGLGALQGGIDMGAQSGGGEAAQQLTNQGAGIQQGFDTSKLATAFASGALGGVVIGAGGAMFHPGAEPTDTSNRPTPEHTETAETGEHTSLLAPDTTAALNTQLELNLNQAPPGNVAGSPQGELFRTTAEAQQPAAAQAAEPQTPPPAASSSAAQGATAQPTGGASQTPPVAAAGQLSMTLPEPKADLIAQLKAVGDPNNPKDTAFIPAGGLAFTKSVRDAIPKNAKVVARPGVGRLITTSEEKANFFKTAKTLGDDDMADLLGYPESKSQVAAAGGSPTVVQGQDAQGNVVHESVASPQGVPDAVQAAQQVAPNVQQLTPEQALARRQEQTNEPASPTGPVDAAPSVQSSPAAEATAAQPTEIDQAAAQAEQPTAAQAEAGNYQKGHVKVGGLDVSIETPKGGVRRGVNADGTPWETTMPAHYGYVRRTTGADGDHVDVTLGPNAHQPDKGKVYVFDQKDPQTGMFDEHKAFIGFDGPAQAMDAYDKSFSDGSGPTRRGAVTEMPFDQFKDWATSGDTTKALKYKPTVSDQLKAKRAAQKQKMATPDWMTANSDAAVDLAKKLNITDQIGDLARQGKTAKEISAAIDGKLDAAGVRAVRDSLGIKAAGPTVAFGSVIPDEEPVERTRDQTMQQIRDAVTSAKIVPLQKGADVGPILDRVVNEIMAKLGTAKNDGDIQEAVAKWARSNGTPINGTRTRRIEIGDRVMRALNGKTVDEFSGRAQRIGDEVARESKPSAVYESEGAARKADLESAHAREQDQARDNSTTVGETSEGVTQAYEGNELPEPQKIVDKLPWWLDRVVNGQMTVQEADQAYGQKAPGRGRPRQYPTFSHYLDERIRQAEDPAIADKLRELLSNESRKSDQAKSAESVQIEHLLAQTGKDFADKLRDLKAELDPVGEAVKAAEPTTDKYGGKRAVDVLRERAAARKAGESLGRPNTNTYARVLNDDRVNSVVDNLLAENRTRPVHDYLNAIASDTLVQQETPAMASLARRLRTLVRPSVEVHVGTTDPTDAGRYFPNGGGRIEVNPIMRVSRVETVLHEALHDVTSRYIDSLPDGHADRQLLQAMHDELTDAAEAAAERGSLTPAAIEDLQYALSNAHEMHTMLLTNPHLQQLAANHVPSSQFRMRMQGLGYPLQAAKSVWTAFTAFVRRSLGLKGVATATDASLLDHVMRPAQDIADRAAEFNRRADPTDINDVASHALPDFKAGKDELLRHVDLPTVGDKVMKGALMSATTDAIVDHNSRLFERDGQNSLRNYRSASEAIAARSKDFHDAYADKIADWSKQVTGLPDRDKLASLLVDASTADVKLGKGLNNDKALQARYDALSPKAKALYDQSHQIQDAMYAEERQARLNGMLKGVMPDATKAQLDAIRDVASSQVKTKAFLADPDNHDIASKFGADWGTMRQLVKGIAQIHDMGFVKGDYFPLRRFGDYVLHYGERGTDGYGMEKFETIGAADARRQELLKQGVEGLSAVQSQRVSHMRDMVSMPAIDEIASAMRRRGDSEDHVNSMRDLMASVVMQHATHSAGARARLRRQGVLGASTQVEKVVANDFLAAASRTGYLEHGVDRAQALQAMQDHADYLGRNGTGKDQRVAQAVTNELQKRVPNGDDGDSLVSKVLRKASPFGYIQSLMSPSHMLTSTIEAHMNSTALLGSRHGVMRAGIAIGKALKDASPVLGTGARNVLNAMGKGLKAADWNLSSVVRDRMIAAGADRGHMTKLFNSLNGAGLIDHTFVRELQRIANPKTDLSRGWWGKFLDLNSAGAHAVDVANKSAIAKAAFDLEFKKTGDVDASVRYATDMARKAMPNYNTANKSRISTSQGPLGGLAAPITQFKQYGIHMYSMMANLVHQWQHGATPAERREGRNAFAAILATHTAMAGVLTLIGDPLRWIGGAYDWATGANQPHDYENDVRRVIADTFGPELGEIISRGLPHAAGIDIHRRVGLSNLLEPPELNEFNAKGYALAAMQALTGASGEDAANMADGMSQLLSGNIRKGLLEITPRIVRDAMKAQGLATSGVTDSKGKTIMTPEQVGTGGVVAQAMGFQPAKVSEFREARFATLEARQEMAQARSKLIQGWLQAAPDDRAAAKEQIDEYNRANPAARITIEQLLQAKQSAKTKSQRQVQLYGLNVPRKEARSLSQAGAFANTQ